MNQIIAIRDFPNEIRSDLGLYVSCIAGAISVEEFESSLLDAGFKGVLLPALGVFLLTSSIQKYHLQTLTMTWVPAVQSLLKMEGHPVAVIKRLVVGRIKLLLLLT